MIDIRQYYISKNRFMTLKRSDDLFWNDRAELIILNVKV